MPVPSSIYRQARRGADLSAAAPLLAVIVLLAALSGCSFEYRETGTAEEETALPDYILHDTTYTISRAGLDRIEFTAQKASFYTSERLVLLEALSFRQLSGSGELLTTGSSDFGEIDTDSYDVRMEGDVLLEALSEESRISTGRLRWDHDDNMLLGEPGIEATVVYRDGSRVTGTDLRIDGNERYLEFSQVRDGVVRYE